MKLRLPALTLLAATILFWSNYDRYEAAGPILLESPVLAAGTSMRGNVTESDSCFSLRVPKSGEPARIDIPVPGALDYKMIRLRAGITVDGVVVGKYPWSCARVLLAQYDKNSKWISGHHGLAAEEGTKAWERYEDVFDIYPHSARVVVILQQSGVEGTAQFKHIEARPVRVRASFIRWRILFAVSWCVMAVLYFSRCRLHRRRLKVLIFLNAIAILAGTLMPGEWIAEGVNDAATAIREFRKPEPAEVAPAVKTPAPKPVSPQKQMDWFMEMEVETHQAGHFVLFATLCFLVYLSAALERQHASYFFKVGVDVLLFAAISESLQLLTLDRTAGVGDLRVDLYGMGAALLLFLMVLPLVRRLQAKPS